MARTYIIVDGMNLFFRCVNTVSPNSGVDVMAGMALHTIFNSVRKAWRDFNGDHIVFAHEGRNNWRKEVYPKYKLNRKIARLSMTETERENQEILLGAFAEMGEFLSNKTNVTNLQHNDVEADDMIAMFIQSHPDDNHVLVSSDSDYVQLLKHKNVTIYNGVTGVILKQDGVYNDKGKKLEFSIKSDSKIKVGAPNPSFIAEEKWYEFAMFLKKVRGDKSDNIFSAFPGARLTGTKNKVGIREAYEDSISGGYMYNNFMLQRWVNEEDKEMIVKEQFELNHKLIDLESQPYEIRKSCLEAIAEQTNKEPVNNVGIHFMRFAGQWNLNKIADSAHDFSHILNAKYK